MKRLVRLEKMLEKGLERLRHPAASRTVLEAIPEVLDAVEDRIEPTGGRGRAFPYRRVLVAFRVSEADRAGARALARDLPERIRGRLASRGCAAPEGLEIAVRCVAARGAGWGDRPFKIHFTRQAEGVAAKPAAPRPQAPPLPALRLVVLRGRTGEKEHELALERINFGRHEKVASASGRGARKNHVWFAASEDTVSRAHARIERTGGAFLLFDEGSTSGTRVIRRGEEIELMPRGTRGVRLEPGDRIELGKGCVVEVAMVRAE